MWPGGIGGNGRRQGRKHGTVLLHQLHTCNNRPCVMDMIMYIVCGIDLIHLQVEYRYHMTLKGD